MATKIQRLSDDLQRDFNELFTDLRDQDRLDHDALGSARNIEDQIEQFVQFTDEIARIKHRYAAEILDHITQEEDDDD